MNIDQHILIRYFLGQASEEEKEWIHQWIEQDEENRKQIIRERIRFDATLLADIPAVSPKRRLLLRLPALLGECLKVAAVLLLLFIGIQQYGNYQEKQLAESYQSVSVPSGNRTHLLLPDGTSVWLSGNTSLRYPLAFSKKGREIELDGEAYFEVAKGKTPFLVKTEKYDVEVLGTVFNIEAYSNKSHFKTILYEGKVKLYDLRHTKEVFLLPGETAELIENELKVAPTKDKNSYRWKDGLICIEDKSFMEIMALFEKYYDVRIIVNNKSVRELGYHGKLRISDGIDHALHVLQHDFSFAYKWDKAKNIIYIN